MKLIDDLRRENLTKLRLEFGGLKVLSEKLERDDSQVSQWILGSKNSGTGKPRGMRSDTARYIELKCGKPEGWLDHDHTDSTASPTQTAQPPQEYQQNKALELVQQAQPATNSIATLAQITAALSRHFETMDANTRKMAVGLLGQLADDPKDHARIAAMIEFSIHSKHQKLA